LFVLALAKHFLPFRASLNPPLIRTQYLDATESFPTSVFVKKYFANSIRASIQPTKLPIGNIWEKSLSRN
ncbi:hypothetical protein PN482_15840, partial [Microcystis aeruginosa CS-555/01A07]|uniref:hypothetical protein n=1 Tax=Microcystis aeruginosa TaxID=1126 RepID=UPI00232A9A1F